MAWKLSDATKTALDTFHRELEGDVESLRKAFDKRSDKFRESDQGTEIGSWIEDLENLADRLDGINGEPNL